MAWLEGAEYYWVVLCRNRDFHNENNLYSRHAILLAETDEVSPAPQVRTFTVRCDDCGQEDNYSAQDVLRAELYNIESFTPHPLFQHLTPKAVATADDSAHDFASKKPVATADNSAHASVSSGTTGKTTVIERIRAKVVPYLRFRKKETLPYWRRPPQSK